MFYKKNTLQDLSFKFQRGFTLLEIIIAITLLSLLSLGIFNITDQSITTKDRVILEDRDLLQVETFFSRLELDFSQIDSPLFSSLPVQTNPNELQNSPYVTSRIAGITEDSRLIPVFLNEESSSITFFTTANRRKYMNEKTSDYAWARYSTQANSLEDARGPLEITRTFLATDPYNEAFDFDNIKGSPILQNVKELHFYFWNDLLKKYNEKTTELSRNDHLIKGLGVRLVWISTSGEELTFDRTIRPLYPQYIPQRLRAQNTNENTGTNSAAGNRQTTEALDAIEDRFTDEY